MRFEILSRLRLVQKLRDIYKVSQFGISGRVQSSDLKFGQKKRHIPILRKQSGELVVTA